MTCDMLGMPAMSAATTFEGVSILYTGKRVFTLLIS